MRNLLCFTIALAAVTFVASASAQQAGSTNTTRINYPSVAAALEGLRARSDVDIRTQDGWTIVDDRASSSQWTFTPPNEPAYPAVVKRVVTNRNGALFVEMAVLCQAEKLACDKLVAEFTEMNEALRQSSNSSPDTDQQKWAPSERQKSRAEDVALRYLEAIDGGRYQDAYNQHTAGLNSIMTFEQFESFERSFRAEHGDDPVREDFRVTWYNDPPSGSLPGVYAAYDITCQYPSLSFCAEVLILHQQSDGQFLVMRKERNVAK